jgi:hypothetical protein
VTIGRLVRPKVTLAGALMFLPLRAPRPAGTGLTRLCEKEAKRGNTLFSSDP